MNGGCVVLQRFDESVNATAQYRLTVSEYVGTVDDMRYSSGARFFTKDSENDTSCKLQFAVVR